MPAPVSVVIPTLNGGATLAGVLRALAPGNEGGFLREVVVSDGGSCDETLEIADAAGCAVVTGAPGRGAQLARGAAVARGGWLLFLHADTLLSENWLIAASRQLGAPAQAAAFRLAFDGAGLRPRLVAGGANLRASIARLPYGDQGLLIARPLYEAVGGYDPDMPLFEDVDLVRRLVRARGRSALRLLPATAHSAPTRYERQGYARRVLSNQWLLARYLAGTPAAALARSYG